MSWKCRICRKKLKEGDSIKYDEHEIATKGIVHLSCYERKTGAQKKYEKITFPRHSRDWSWF